MDPNMGEGLADQLIRKADADTLHLLMQSGRNTAGAIITASDPSLRLDRFPKSLFLDEGDSDMPVPPLCFPEKMDGEKRTCWTSADDGDVVSVF